MIGLRDRWHLVKHDLRVPKTLAFELAPLAKQIPPWMWSANLIRANLNSTKMWSKDKFSALRDLRHFITPTLRGKMFLSPQRSYDLNQHLFLIHSQAFIFVLRVTSLLALGLRYSESLNYTTINFAGSLTCCKHTWDFSSIIIFL